MSGTQLSLQNFTTLVQNLASAVQGSSTQAINLDEGSVIRAILEADASQALWLQYLVVLVLGVTRLATSQGTACDTFGADFGYTRLPAVSATGSVTFSRYTNTQAAFLPVYVPAAGNTPASGTQVQTADGTQTFDLVADSSNPNYVASPVAGYNLPGGTSSITLPVIADVPGVGGNVLADTISLILTGIPGIDTVDNASPTTGGENAESDAAFKARFVYFVNSRSQGTAEAVEYALQQIQQNVFWSLQENQTANGTYTPGTFVVTVDDGSGDPSDAFIETCTTAVQAVRPIGSTAIVQGPTEVAAGIEMTISIQPSANLTIIEGEVTTALASYVNSLPVGAPLPYSKVAQIAWNADPNILNVTEILVNSGTVDLTVTESQVIRAGTIVIS